MPLSFPTSHGTLTVLPLWKDIIRQGVKWSDWWNDLTARVTEWFTHYHITYKSLLVSKELILHGTLNTIRRPCEKISSLECRSKNLDQRQDVKRLDWWNDRIAIATEWFPHYHINSNVRSSSFKIYQRSVLVSVFLLDDVMLHSGNCSDCQT